MVIYNLHTMNGEEGVSSPLSLALGSFDGVHLGHAALLGEAVRYAKEHPGVRSAVWCFDGSKPLPNKPDQKRITSVREQLALFASLGVDYALLEDFSAVRDYSPERFVKEILIGQCRAECVVCGFNFRFGQYGAGDSRALSRLMEPYGSCIVVPPVRTDGETVSSTAIRLLIENGEMERAAALLGHPYFIELPVLHGKALGRKLGVPTINQRFPDGSVLPKTGVYCCTVSPADTPDRIYPGVANVGLRPTVAEGDDHLLNCETHIIGFDGWLYDRFVRVSFGRRLRGEKQFDSLDALKEQISHDIREAELYHHI